MWRGDSNDARIIAAVIFKSVTIAMIARVVATIIFSCVMIVMICALNLSGHWVITTIIINNNTTITIAIQQAYRGTGAVQLSRSSAFLNISAFVTVYAQGCYDACGLECCEALGQQLATPRKSMR